MDEEKINKIYELLDNMDIPEYKQKLVEEIKDDLNNRDFENAIAKLRQLENDDNFEEQIDEEDYNNDNESEYIYDENDGDMESEEEIENENRNDSSEQVGLYPKELENYKLERTYISLLINEPRYITKYYFLFRDCHFQDEKLLNIYKSVLFTEGGKYTSEIAKQGFNFSKDTQESYKLKVELRYEGEQETSKMEKVYADLQKLFILRRSYVEIPIPEIQEKIVEIKDYLLYEQMTAEEVESAVNQVQDTGKFKRAILNTGLTDFLKLGDNNLTNGLDLPFYIMTSVFKGIRKGETMAFAMPSNSGKSRFTINVAAHTALVHKKKVLIISNEMSEEKMRLCLITTIINNPEIQKMHGYKISKTEGELLEFKFRPDEGVDVKVDENGYIIKEENESQKVFAKRLQEISTEFRNVLAITDWANKEIKNSIYFINITDHTNDELKKVIMNYYFKEKIEYVFYDTLKTDTANIGIGEELKKTATILSNLAQNFGMYICSTLQLAESNTLPVNLNVNDLAVSRTVKEVLDTLSLIKQIHRDTLQNYEYSLNEIDTVFYDLEKFEDPDVRYYACVIDKNRAGAKPTLLFRLNLAYNVWEELGYLRLKQGLGDAD